MIGAFAELQLAWEEHVHFVRELERVHAGKGNDVGTWKRKKYVYFYAFQIIFRPLLATVIFVINLIIRGRDYSIRDNISMGIIISERSALKKQVLKIELEKYHKFVWVWINNIYLLYFYERVLFQTILVNTFYCFV